MSTLLRRGVNVFIAMTLALGWVWANFLKERNILDESGRALILLGVTGLLFVQQVWLVLPKPAPRSKVEARKPISDNYLRGFLLKYYASLERAGAGGQLPPVRVNVMLPTKRARGLLGAHLKIYYAACPPGGGAYTAEQMALRWSRNVGTCGWAWAHQETTLYDSKDPELHGPAKRLPGSHLEAVRNIGSVLSTPIWSDGRIVGVLNLDSKRNVCETKFTEDEVLELAMICARDMGAQCFEDGVKEVRQ